MESACLTLTLNMECDQQSREGDLHGAWFARAAKVILYESS